MRPAGRLAALILAAGRSSRAPGFKPLLPLGEATVVENTVGSLRRAGINDVTIVAGHRADELLPAVTRLSARCVVNKDYDAGMFSSVVAGVKALPADVDAFFLLPADMPLVSSRTIRLLARAGGRSGADVVYPVFQGQRGHPPLISTRLAPAILSWGGDGGLRSLLAKYEAGVCDVPVIDEGILLDIDTEDDYRLVVERHAHRHFPTGRECEAILACWGVPEAVVRHCRVVADVAREIAVQLNGAGLCLNEGLVAAAGLLHDLAKGKPHHPRRGARILRSLGYPAAAEIVVCHHDIALPQEQSLKLDEAAIVFLADKLVKNDKIVSLDERFARCREMFAADPNAEAAAAGRLNQALRIAGEVEKVLGRKIVEMVDEDIFRKAGAASR